MKTKQTTIPKAFHLVLVLEFLYLEFVSDLELRISNFFISHLEEIRLPILEFLCSGVHEFLNTLILQNEPNFKTVKIAISDFLNWTKDLGLKTIDSNNEPKRTQFVTPASSRQLSTSQASSLTPQDYIKIQNEPNFKTTQNDVSHFPTTVYCILSPVYWKKNKPKRTQFRVPAGNRGYII